MDRRTLLAFALIFVILIGSQMLMEAIYGPKNGGQGPDSLQVAFPEDPEAVDIPAGQIAWDPPPSPPSNTVPGERQLLSAAEALEMVTGEYSGPVTIESPLYRLQIDPVGGRIISWEGLNYASHLGGSVQLIPGEIPATGMDAIIFSERELDLGRILYQPDQTGEIRVNAGSGRTLTLTAVTRGGLLIQKTFTFDPSSYEIVVDLVLRADDPLQSERTLGLVGRPNFLRFGWNQGISHTERNQKMEQAAMRSFARVGEEYQYKKQMNLKKGREKVEAQLTGSVHFAGLQNRYFTVVGIVPQIPGAPVEGTIQLSGDPELLLQSWAIQLPASRVGSEIAAGRIVLFVGPQEAPLLAAAGQGLEKTMDLGWKLFRPLASMVLTSMAWMHRFIPNYGLIIILFSLLTKVLFYPLTKKSTESMKKMQELQPKLKAVQEKYKDNKEKLNQATMNLYKEEKVNPLAGCLPLLVQSPVFIALYQALNHTIALRGQPFVLWIKDLSQPDALAQLPIALPFLGSDLNVLPILMSAAMYFQSKMTPTSGGGQMAAMTTMLPLIMVFIFYNMPSGLVLYWLVNTILQGYQSWKIHKTAPADQGVQTT